VALDLKIDRGEALAGEGQIYTGSARTYFILGSVKVYDMGIIGTCLTDRLFQSIFHH
jgi:hypothetical protein